MLALAIYLTILVSSAVVKVALRNFNQGLIKFLTRITDREALVT